MKTSLIRAQGKIAAVRNHMRNVSSIADLAAAILALADAIDELTKEHMRNELLQQFAQKYNVVFTRETFSFEGPKEDGTFILGPDEGGPLPPVGCKIKVHGYQGQTWRTVVTSIDDSSGTYTATVEQ